MLYLTKDSLGFEQAIYLADTESDKKDLVGIDVVIDLIRKNSLLCCDIGEDGIFQITTLTDCGAKVAESLVIDSIEPVPESFIDDSLISTQVGNSGLLFRSAGDSAVHNIVDLILGKNVEFLTSNQFYIYITKDAIVHRVKYTCNKVSISKLFLLDVI